MSGAQWVGREALQWDMRLGQYEALDMPHNPWLDTTKKTMEGNTMTTTDQDIQALTPQHRIVWHSPPGQPVEMGLCVSEGGYLLTDAGHLVRYPDGHVVPSVPCRIIRIIPPAC